ncbi:Fucose permease [Arachidicoccus rhizosphaerae]|uniref:Fucose permease n=1 Tax=Arachidicoccus rhizosphaerae TaxID=551991 RepID=A0A1H3VHH8_9BACT|nr:MFS transporter [Arachidicoccus rhizosphaerae]SDZ74190.1 Fucose permease [Arachidicoccus rhizosphaerae]
MLYSQKRVFAGACLGILIFGMGITTLGSVKQDLMQRFSLSEIGAGTLFSILPLGILTGSLLFGPAADKYGFKYILSGCCLSMFLGFEGMAFASSWWLLRICVFLFGLGGGAMNGASSALVADLSGERKGANLSILGVFFGMGALGMPLVLAALVNRIAYDVIIAAVGALSLAVCLFYLCIRFPAAKLGAGFPIKQVVALIKDPVLLLIAFFLFCQSSLESLVNNWSTSYLIGAKGFADNQALFALSLSVAGMTVMRLLLGSLLKNRSGAALWKIAFILLLSGWALTVLPAGYLMNVLGLIFIGAGLAGGFPLMLGLVADRFSQLSATAFSVVLVVALAGNMLVNYLMGVVVQRSGIQNWSPAIIIEWVVMAMLCVAIVRKTGKQPA